MSNDVTKKVGSVFYPFVYAWQTSVWVIFQIFIETEKSRGGENGGKGYEGIRCGSDVQACQWRLQQSQQQQETTLLNTHQDYLWASFGSWTSKLVLDSCVWGPGFNLQNHVQLQLTQSKSPPSGQSGRYKSDRFWLVVKRKPLFSKYWVLTFYRNPAIHE